MTKWLIVIVFVIVLGAALWMTGREGIVIAYGAGLATGGTVMIVRQRSKG